MTNTTLSSENFYLIYDIKPGVKFTRYYYKDEYKRPPRDKDVDDNTLCIVTNVTLHENSRTHISYLLFTYMYLSNDKIKVDDKETLYDLREYYSGKTIKQKYPNTYLGICGSFIFKKPSCTKVYLKDKYYNVQAILSNKEKIFSIKVNIRTLYKKTLINFIMESLKETLPGLKEILEENIIVGFTGIVSIGTTIDFLFDGLKTVYVIILGSKYTYKYTIGDKSGFLNSIIKPLSSTNMVKNYTNRNNSFINTNGANSKISTTNGANSKISNTNGANAKISNTNGANINPIANRPTNINPIANRPTNINPIANRPTNINPTTSRANGRNPTTSGANAKNSTTIGANARNLNKNRTNI